MANLPWGTIVDILLRLPVEDLLRYKCVSKGWCGLIQSRSFVKRHLSHSIETSSNLCVILNTGHEFHSVELDCELSALESSVRVDPPIFTGHGVEILGFCNGLVVLMETGPRYDTVIWNPATKQCRKVPMSDLNQLPGSIFYDIGIAGFGYDPVNDDHKFLRMLHYCGNNPVRSLRSEVNVYSLNTNTWKRVADFPYLGKHCGKSLLVGSSFHWLLGLQLGTKISTVILAFDLVTEKYRQIPRADTDTKGKAYYSTITELGGWLCEVVKYGGHSEKAQYVEFWVMKEYGVKESWTKLCTVVPSNVTGSFTSIMPLKYFKKAHQILFDQDNKKLMLYDLERKEAKSVRSYTKTCGKIACVRSLIGVGVDKPNSGKEAEEDLNKKNNEKEKQQPTGKKWDDFLSKGVSFKLVL